jgi:hypothetical protein
VDGLDPMSVQIDDERGVVAGSIVRARPGRAAVGCAVEESCRVERVDRSSRRRGEGQVETGPAGLRTGRLLEGELVSSGFDSVARKTRRVEYTAIPERAERRVIEGCRALEVHDREGKVMEQSYSSRSTVRRSSAEAQCLDAQRLGASSKSQR